MRGSAGCRGRKEGAAGGVMRGASRNVTWFVHCEARHRVKIFITRREICNAITLSRCKDQRIIRQQAVALAHRLSVAKALFVKIKNNQVHFEKSGEGGPVFLKS